MTERWRPNVTVAAVVVKDDCYLMVEEQPVDSDRPVLNQPAGHLEQGETLLAAVHREVLEETGIRVRFDGVLAFRQVTLFVGLIGSNNR